MSDRDILTDQLYRNPDEPALRAMLIDATIEECECTRLAAERAVHVLVESALEARELSQAAALLRSGSEVREEIHKAIGCFLQLDHPHQTTVCLIPGDSFPLLAGARTNANAKSYWPHWTVTVGCRWVIRQAARTRKSNRSAQRDE